MRFRATLALFPGPIRFYPFRCVYGVKGAYADFEVLQSFDEKFTFSGYDWWDSNPNIFFNFRTLKSPPDCPLHYSWLKVAQSAATVECIAPANNRPPPHQPPSCTCSASPGWSWWKQQLIGSRWLFEIADMLIAVSLNQQGHVGWALCFHIGGRQSFAGNCILADVDNAGLTLTYPDKPKLFKNWINNH